MVQINAEVTITIGPHGMLRSTVHVSYAKTLLHDFNFSFYLIIL